MSSGAAGPLRRLSTARLATAVTAAVAALVLTGCGEQPRPGSPDRTGDSAARADRPEGLREDEEPVRARFPEFGDFTSVVWEGEVLGANDRSVPGPTDVRMAGVVHLADADARRLREGYSWQAASVRPRVPKDLLPHVPDGAHWRTSDGFTRAVTGDRYPATFHADLERRVLVFEAVNPQRKG
ncbi:hypothetical protein ABZZ79_30410 [Streptomyces sp. NPDC006458]|uniref:hypothetical protein n=1 Tax=Streptomyces sp. NPDC006458 TaxID=3154302 RepID=UPI0033AA7B6A